MDNPDLFLNIFFFFKVDSDYKGKLRILELSPCLCCLNSGRPDEPTADFKH